MQLGFNEADRLKSSAIQYSCSVQSIYTHDDAVLIKAVIKLTLCTTVGGDVLQSLLSP